MTNKSNFTPAEWKVLLQSMIAAGTAVTAAEPSGLWGLLKESFAGGTTLAKANNDPGTNELIKAVVADFATTEGSAARDELKDKFKNSKLPQIKDKCIETLREAGYLPIAAFCEDSVAVTREALYRTPCGAAIADSMAPVSPRKSRALLVILLKVLHHHFGKDCTLFRFGAISRVREIQ